MKKVIKKTVGVDCAKDELVCCLSMLYEDMEIENVDIQIFTNKNAGFLKLLNWVLKKTQPNDLLSFVVEATGVYHEAFAHYLVDHGQKISIVLPSKIKNYRKTLDIKTDNDKTASIAIAEFGLVKKLDSWQKPNSVFRMMRDLLRERDQIVQERTMCKNQLHAKQHGAYRRSGTEKRLKQRVKLCEGQAEDIEREMRAILDQQPELKQKVDKICTIKGVGPQTALTVIAETDGFNLIKNKKQLVSYCGLDVVEKTSGTSVRGRARISKRGNVFIRKALYFPSQTAVKHNIQLKEDYARIVHKTAIKMKGLVAIQRKLLILIYTLWKKDEEYDPEFYKKSGQSSLTGPTELEISALEIQR